MSEGKYFISHAQNVGAQQHIDPKMKNLAQRDIELAKQKRDRMEHQRETEKKQRRDPHRKCVKQGKSKDPYRNVQSKIKKSVQRDKEK